MTITLPSEIEVRLRGEATRRGLPAEELATRLLAEHLPSPSETPAQSLKNLFAQWDAEDYTTDPEEIARRNRELSELKEAMNRNRVESDGPNARKPFG